MVNSCTTEDEETESDDNDAKVTKKQSPSFDRFFNNVLRSAKNKSKLQQPKSINIKNEIEEYLEDSLIYFKSDEELLCFWNTNQNKYPVLAAMARDYLAITSSAVASESAFSKGRRTCRWDRSMLADHMVECLQCLKSWFQFSREPEEYTDLDTIIS